MLTTELPTVDQALFEAEADVGGFSLSKRVRALLEPQPAFSASEKLELSLQS